jgi:hypothetical protein
VRTKRNLLTAVVLFQFVLPLSAQDDGKKHERHRKLSELLTTLSSADREKYHAARKQAMTNPEVADAAERRKKADEEYRQLLRREILKSDPSLAPFLDKLSQLRRHDDL